MANQFPLPTPPSDFVPPSAGQTPLPPPPQNPATPPSYQAPEPVAAAPIAKSPFRLVVPLVLGLLVLGGIAFLASKFLANKSSTTGPSTSTSTAPANVVTLNYWGLWETADIMKPVIDAFQAANPNIKVNYTLQSFQDYQDRLNTAITGKSGPDVARIHATWMPIFISKLLPAPANSISATEIQTNLYPVAASTVLAGNQVYGVPTLTDGLVLFVNTNMLSQKNLTKPTSWEDLANDAKALTERDPATGKITRAGVALGTTTNVTHWMDIVSLMMLQAGVNLLQPSTKNINEVLTFYTDFAAPGKYWDETMPDSIQAFANEKVAMIIAPLWRIPDIQAINSKFAWEIAPVPQLPAVDPVNWSSMWVEVVPQNAPHPQEAWKFVSFMASAKAQQLLFDSAQKIRGSSEIPTNKAATTTAAQNPLLAPFVSELPTAKTFYTAGFTRDSSTGLNARLIKYLEDAINSTAKKQDPNKVIDTLNQGFNQVLSQYRLVTPLPTPTQ